MADEIDLRQAMVVAESFGVDVKALAALTNREAKVRLVLSWVEGVPEDDPRFILLWSIIVGVGANALVSAGADPLDTLTAARAGAQQRRAEQAAKVPQC